MEDELEAWGERALLIYRAAKEINETGEVCVDTFMQVQRHAVAPEEVARMLKRIVELEAEEHDLIMQDEENEKDGEE